MNKMTRDYNVSQKTYRVYSLTAWTNRSRSE